MSNYEYISKYTSTHFTPAKDVKSVFGYDRKVDGIVIHHWGVLNQKFDNIITFFLHPDTKTSAHYVVQDGKVACIVDPDDAAWHAGNAQANATKIGIELRPEATDGDYATAAELIKNIRATYGDLPLYPHSKFRTTTCPGKWDLGRLDRLARASSTKTTPTSAPASTTPTTTKSEASYTIKKGDTLWKIATAHGMTTLELAKLNNMSTSDIIHEGNKLKVKSLTYTVKAGDELNLIANKFGITVKRLADLNGISNPDKIYVGQTLKIG